MLDDSPYVLHEQSTQHPRPLAQARIANYDRICFVSASGVGISGPVKGPWAEELTAADRAAEGLKEEPARTAEEDELVSALFM